MIGGIIEFQESGPEALRLTAAQRNQLRPLWPKIRARLERNEAQPSDLDEQVRTVLAQDQKAAIRALLSGRKVHLPPTLKAYVTPFESLLDGTYQKGALAAAEAAPPRTSPSARPATPQSIPTPRPQTSRPATAADPFEDIYLHDAIGAILVIEREGPPEARLTAAQRLALKQLWPEIRKRLEANDWKPAALDVQVVGTLSSAQRKALREVRAKGRLQLPPNLTVYLEPFERVLSR